MSTFKLLYIKEAYVYVGKIQAPETKSLRKCRLYARKNDEREATENILGTIC
jgi:hypothetical protein